MIIRLTQLDGKLPNLALMKLGAWHQSCGDSVFFHESSTKGIFEPKYDIVYGSTIFSFTSKKTDIFRRSFPNAILGGTGSLSDITVEKVIGDFKGISYDFYPDFKNSIGFTQRGCRFRCKFCVVPAKEGFPSENSSIKDIWRGYGHPKNILLLDNDFFGQTKESWKSRIEEIREGKFRVCFSQGINIRVIGDEEAEALASIEYRNNDFNRRRIYTAWDNIGDEEDFFRGVEILNHAGIPPNHLMAYMLIGFSPSETWEKIWHRFNRMVSIGILPYPMVYDKKRADLMCFQRWVIRGLYRTIPWNEYKRKTKSEASECQNM